MATTPNLEGTLEEFSGKITTVVNCLNDNETILNITSTNLADLNILYTNPGVTIPQSELGWMELWMLHNDDNTKTKTVNGLVQSRRIQLKKAVSSICNDIPQSALTENHRSALNWPLSKSTKTKHNVGTKNQVSFSSVGLGGGDVRTKCFPSGAAVNNPLATHSKTKGKRRRNKPYKEEGYEIRRSYILIKPNSQLPTEPNATGMTMEIITKADSVKHYGTGNAGMLLCEFMQWYNPKHPELAGPWSALQTLLIS
jgi:hypothetical protein